MIAARRAEVLVNEDTEYRPGRLRVHGAHALECVPAGAALLRPSLPAGSQGGRRAQCGARQGVCRQLGLRVDRDRLAQPWSRARTSTSSTSPAPTTRISEIAIAAAKAGKMVMCEKPLGRTAAEALEMVAAVESAGVPNTVWYNYRRVPAVTHDQEPARRGQVRPHLPLPRQVPAGLDDLAGSAAGRRGAVAPRRRRSPAAASPAICSRTTSTRRCGSTARSPKSRR